MLISFFLIGGLKMDIENMKAFVTVEELKSISAAATKLNHLQSNMTSKIKKIESHYNTELFIRNSRGVQLTKDGEKLYGQYKRILFLWEETENKMKKYEQKLRIGTSSSVGGMQFASSLKKLYMAYPDLSVTFKTGGNGFVENEILLGNLDLGYTLGLQENKQLYYKKMGFEEVVIIGNGIDKNTKLEEYLIGKNILVLSQNCWYTTILSNIYHQLNIEKGEHIEVGELETLVQFAMMGMGISLVAKRSIKRYKIDNYLEVPSVYRFMNYYLITRLNHEFTPIEKQFIELNESIS